MHLTSRQRDNLTTVQSRSKSRVGLVIGSLVRLPQRLLEPLRERVAARPLGGDRLLEERLAPRRFVGEDALRVGQLRPIAAHRLDVAHDALQVGVDDERRTDSTGRWFRTRT